jgi:choline transport protein
MQEEMELKSGSAVWTVPAGNGNGAYEGVSFRQKQQLEVDII